jgi:hypothetical protein
MRKVQIVRLCTAAGMCMGIVSLAQSLPATQPQVHFWEPPKAAIQLRAQFGPMVRILICNPDATAQRAVNAGVAPIAMSCHTWCILP